MAKVNLDFYSGKDFYSEGEIENEILSIIKKGDDVDKVLSRDNRWSILYHLSPIRQNIINWYPFRNQSSALEIGGGCGAITGVLCDSVASVTSIELSKVRASIIQERYKGHNNLEIIVGNFNDIKIDKKFDYITLIGVLEYSGSFTDGDSPYKTFLKKIYSMLNEKGVLLIAIENRYGIKYWSGAKEDHTGIAFDGITGYQDTEKVRTFGKLELEQLVKESGYSKSSFYYPCPDYKMPTVLYSDDFLPKSKEEIPLSINYDNDRLDVFSERDAYTGILENNQFDFFSNSFLVECTK